MKKTTRNLFAPVFFALFVLLAVTSCKNLFNHSLDELDSEITQKTESAKSSASSGGNGLSAVPQIVSVSLGASTNQKPTTRTVFPAGFNPTIESFTGFTLSTSEPINGKSILSWSTYDAFTRSVIDLDSTKTYALTLSATYQAGTWSSDQITWNKSDRTIQFTLKPTGTGTFSVSLDITAVAEQAQTVKFWISDTAAIDRTKTPTGTFDAQTGKDSPITWSDPNRASGKFYALFEILDKNGASTIVGPEAIYVFPGQTSLWTTPVIEVLNRNYKITFSLEGMEYKNLPYPNDPDFNYKVSATLVPGSSLPEPYVQNIYETSQELPNLNDVILRTPTGYEFYAWWDGETFNQYGQPAIFNKYGSTTIGGGKYTDDITLYPVWLNYGYIYDYSTREDIENYVNQRIQDELVDSIIINLPDGFKDFANNTEVWNTTISVLNNNEELMTSDKGVELRLNCVDSDWLVENLARVAGTDDKPNTWLSVITLPQSPSKIPAYAFYNCTALKSISIPTNYTEIGDSAFSGSAITSISIPDSVTTIGASAFKDCAALETVTLSNYSALATIGESAFENTAIKEIFLRYKVATIGDSAFKNCTNLAKVSINSAAPLTSIGANAFEGCAFTTFTLPANVTSMGEAAFAKNEKLTEFLFASGYKLHKIPARCFYGCSDLSKIQLGAGITYVDYDAFFGTALKKETENTRDFACTNQYAAQWTIFTLNEDFQPISCTRSSDIESAIVTNKEKDTERNIERYVRDFSFSVNTADEIFSYIEECKTLNGVIPLGICGGTFEWDDVKNIIDGITCENTNGIELILTSLLIAQDASVEKKTIPAGFFEGKTWLTEISLPHYSSDSPFISVIGDNAFSGCTNLTSITMIDGLTKIGKKAFSECSNLSITLSNKIEYIGTKAFENVKSVIAGLVKDNWTQVTVMDGNASYAHITVNDWKSTIKNEKSSSAFYRDVPLSAFSSTAPDTARVQQMYAIAQDLGVTTLPMWISAEESPVTLTSENAAFNTTISSVAGTSEVYFDLHLEQLTLDGDKTISSGCFNGTSTAKNLWLGSVTLPEVTKLIGTSDAGTFSYCANLKKVSFTNPASLTSIGQKSFYNCTSLSTFNSDEVGTLQLPESIATLQSSCFSYCAFVNADLSATSITSTPGSLFYCTKSLETVKLPSTVTDLGSCSFQTCPKLASVINDDPKYTIVRASCFYGCSELTTIELGNSLTSISQTAFSYAGLRSLTIPASVTTITDRAFQGCSKLTNLIVEGDDSDTWLGSYSWQNQATHKLNLGITNGELPSLLIGDTSNYDFARNPQINSTAISSLPGKINNYNGTTPADTFTITISGSFDDWSYFSALSDIAKTTTVDMSDAIDNSSETEVPFLLAHNSYITFTSIPQGTKPIASYIFDIAGFSFKESFSYPDSGNIVEWDSNSGTYKIERDTQRILFYDISDVTENNLKQYLKTVILKYSAKAPLTPTGDICNYTMSEEFSYAFDTGSGSIREYINHDPSDLDLFKIVTYTIHLGTCDGVPVTSNTTGSTTQGTQDYEYEVSMTPSDCMITGFEGSGFPFSDEHFINQILSETTASNETYRAVLNFPLYCESGEVTITWKDPVIINDEAGLRTAAETGGYYCLTGQINVTEPIIIKKSLTLAGQGGMTYSIKKTDNWETINQPMLVTESNNDEIDLTIKDLILDGGYDPEYDYGVKGGDTGLLDFGGDTIVLNNVTFQNNWKEQDYACFSGLNLKCSEATLTGCTFKNLNIRGGEGRAPGICISKGLVTIKDCLFGNNKANEDRNYGKDIWIDYGYSGAGVTVSGFTQHLDVDSYLEIGTHDSSKLTLGSETGKIKVSQLSNGSEISSENYINGNVE